MEAPDLDKIMFLEHLRKLSEETYQQNPLDVENLSRWGQVLVDLAQYQHLPLAAKNFLQDGMSKLEEALAIDPMQHQARFLLGNALIGYAFSFTDGTEAPEYFARANACIQQALEQDPGNEVYIRSLEVASKAPELYEEVQKGAVPQAMVDAPPSRSSASTSRSTKKKKNSNSDLKYDVLGWVILAVGIVALVGFSKSNVPQPPPPPPPR